MNRLYMVGGLGSVGLLGSFIATVLLLPSKSPELTEELFKALLVFTLAVWGGALIKNVIDEASEKQQRRDAIRKEFIEIFSQFYSVRKLYHSLMEHNQGNAEYTTTKQELLRKSVELEGRYGGLKTLAINHLGLSVKDLGTKEVHTLVDRIDKAERELEEHHHRKSAIVRDLIRDRFDLLGQLYDGWRHALEQDRKIGQSSRSCNKNIDVPKEVWKNYEVLLQYLITGEVLNQMESKRQSRVMGNRLQNFRVGVSARLGQRIERSNGVIMRLLAAMASTGIWDRIRREQHPGHR
jgi:hypothetical protein